MRASKFTEAQKAFIIKQSDAGNPVAENCRKAAISQDRDDLFLGKFVSAHRLSPFRQTLSSNAGQN